jgi:hypothetical protein
LAQFLRCDPHCGDIDTLTHPHESFQWVDSKITDLATGCRLAFLRVLITFDYMRRSYDQEAPAGIDKEAGSVPYISWRTVGKPLIKNEKGYAFRGKPMQLRPKRSLE